jgi:hypothetical protein
VTRAEKSNCSKGQMSVPNLLMVLATLAIFYVSLPTAYNTIQGGMSGVGTSTPEYIIANSIPGAMTLFLVVGIIIYGLIRYGG